MAHKEQSSLFFVNVLCNTLEEGKSLLFSLPLPSSVCRRMMFSSILQTHNIIFKTEIITTYILQKDIGNLLKDYMTTDVSVIHAVL